MNKYSYFDLILKFDKESKNKSFWDELNQIIKSHNIYFRKLNLDQRIKFASETRISSIKDKDYNSLIDLRKGIVSFPPEITINLSDLELLILVLRRCNMVYSYKLSMSFDENNKNENNKNKNNKNENNIESKKDDFVEFINKIDEYIDNFKYDEIFSKPIFSLN